MVRDLEEIVSMLGGETQLLSGKSILLTVTGVPGALFNLNF